MVAKGVSSAKTTACLCGSRQARGKRRLALLLLTRRPTERLLQLGADDSLDRLGGRLRKGLPRTLGPTIATKGPNGLIAGDANRELGTTVEKPHADETLVGAPHPEPEVVAVVTQEDLDQPS